MSTRVTHAVQETEGDGTMERNENGKRKKRFFLFDEKSRAEERNTEEERVELEPSDQQHYNITVLVLVAASVAEFSGKELTEIENEEGESLSGSRHALWTPD